MLKGQGTGVQSLRHQELLLILQGCSCRMLTARSAAAVAMETKLHEQHLPVLLQPTVLAAAEETLLHQPLWLLHATLLQSEGYATCAVSRMQQTQPM